MIDLTEEFKEKQFFLLHGDCLEQMKLLPDNSVDSIVTDPPYGLSFMGKKWDYDVPSTEIWQEALRILKPGGHLLAFAGARTQHRMAVRIEDAGFEIRDMIAWVYGSGFPKSMDVSKAIDATILTGGSHSRNLKQAISLRPGESRATATLPNNGIISGDRRTGITNDNSSTDEAKQWDGWGTALKPALEPITVARKPLIGTVASNVLAYGTGGINIDASRIDLNGDYKCKANGRPSQTGFSDNYDPSTANQTDTVGRFPSNLIHDGSDSVISMFPDSNGAGKSLPQVNVTGYGDKNTGTGSSEYFGGDRVPFDAGSGSAARFFKQCKYETGDFDVIKYCAKTSKKERNEGLDDFPKSISKSVGNGMSNVVRRCPEHNTSISSGGRTYSCGCKFIYSDEDVSHPTANNHPTVKPQELMKYLCQLITPPNGIILDPFNGSGSTGKAAVSLGYKYIGCELDENYVKISNARIQHAIDNKYVVKKTQKSKVIVPETSILDDLFE
jgi:site-specific DNA-methyltransferase (adenine-specific)